MDWIAEVNRLDHEMADAGMSNDERTERLGALVKIHAQIETAIRHLKRDREAANLLHKGAVVVAQRQGCHRATSYRRAARCRMRDAQRDKTG